MSCKSKEGALFFDFKTLIYCQQIDYIYMYIINNALIRITLVLLLLLYFLEEEKTS